MAYAASKHEHAFIAGRASIEGEPVLPSIIFVIRTTSKFLFFQSGCRCLSIVLPPLFQSAGDVLNYLFEKTYSRSVNSIQRTLNSHLPIIQTDQFSNSADLNGPDYPNTITLISAINP